MTAVVKKKLILVLPMKKGKKKHIQLDFMYTASEYHTLYPYVEKSHNCKHNISCNTKRFMFLQMDNVIYNDVKAA